MTWLYDLDIPILKKGGIHIKKKNRGKFTKSAKRAGMGVQEYARHILANKDKYSSTLVKRANFARNAKKFKHEDGGVLFAQNGAGNWWTPQPLSPVGIALNQVRTRTKLNNASEPLPPGVKETIGPDGQKITIRTEQPLQPIGQKVAAWLPGVGDVIEVGQIAKDVKNGNLGTAALAAGLTILPGNAGTVLRKLDAETDKLIRLYRATGTSGNFKPSLDGTAKYAGMWFTDNPRKVNRYASSTFKTAKRNGVDNPIVLEYVDIPKSQLDQFRAKNIIKGNDVEFEPTEDFLIPINHPDRKQVPWSGFTGMYLSDMRIPLPELPAIK